MNKIKYGWIPDLPDQRDFKYCSSPKTLQSLPSIINLNDQCGQIYHQGSLGSCTGNAIGGSLEFNHLKQKLLGYHPSRLFIYYNERKAENTIEVDCGAMIRTGIKSVVKQGACTETLWPYDVSKYAQKPTDACYKEALNHQVLSYKRVERELNQFKGCLASGFPFVFGFTVYEKFESDEVSRTGILDMPLKTEHRKGGHAVLAIGYSDETKRFLVRNSWGKDWGQKGNFTIPYDYLLNDDLSDDFWMITSVE